jgi:hypothetical protein
MTRSIGIAERMRLSSALAATTLPAVTLPLSLRAGRLQTTQDATGAGASAPAGSPLALDPRIAALDG